MGMRKDQKYYNNNRIRKSYYRKRRTRLRLAAKRKDPSETGPLTSAAQDPPSSSLSHQEQNEVCMNTENADSSKDIPLELKIYDENNVEVSEKKIDDVVEVIEDEVINVNDDVVKEKRKAVKRIKPPTKRKPTIYDENNVEVSEKKIDNVVEVIEDEVINVNDDVVKEKRKAVKRIKPPTKRKPTIYDENNVEVSEKKIDDVVEVIEEEEEISLNDDVVKEKPKAVKRIKPPTKRKPTVTRKIRPDIAGVKITFTNLDKFGEQIIFLLKRIPKKLCRELQESIVTLVKSATEQHDSKRKKNVTASAKKFKTPISQPVPPTLDNSNTKHKEKNEQLSKAEETPVDVNSVSDVIMEDYTLDETMQATQLLESQLGTAPDQRITSRLHTNDTFPKPMMLPIELIGSMDCVKQEVFDTEEIDDMNEPELYIEDTTTELTYNDPLKTPIKTEIDETKFTEEARRRENLKDKYF